MYERERRMVEHLTEMNEKLVNLCEKLSGDDKLLKAQLAHKAPSDKMIPLAGRRSWHSIAMELERKTQKEPKQKDEKDAAGADSTR